MWQGQVLVQLPRGGRQRKAQMRPLLELLREGLHALKGLREERRLEKMKVFRVVLKGQLFLCIASFTVPR